MSIAVVYLAWLPARREPIERFVHSYDRYNSGEEHSLFVSVKGKWEGPEVYIECKSRHENIVVPDEGYDIGSYLHVAKLIGHDHILFLNTYSEILCDDWLEKIARHKEAGIIGCTGSWETMNLPNWPSFANTHLRSNAFLINRKLLLSMKFKTPETKEDCWAFESGPDSMTVQAWRKNGPVYVVGRDGKRYPSWEWDGSNTFRSGNQENLIIADNQTSEFQNASPEEKNRLSMLAWGKPWTNAEAADHIT